MLVSGLLSPAGSPARVLDLFTSGHLTLLYDDRILGEYRQVLLRPRFIFHVPDVEALLELIAKDGELVIPTPLLGVLELPDPADLPFLEVALEGAADALVTGNAHHFIPLRGQHHVFVCGPAILVRSWPKLPDASGG